MTTGPGSMRISLVCPYDLGVPGGVQTHVMELAGQLTGAGDAVQVVAPGRRAGPDGSTGRGLPGADGTDGRAFDVAFVGTSVGVPFNDSVAPVSLSPLAARRGLAAIRSFGPTVVHVHEPMAPLLSPAVVMRGPRPMVATFHAWSDTDRAYRALRPVARRALARVGAWIAVSRPAIDYHAGALGASAGDFREIPNGVDVPRFAAAEPSRCLVDHVATGGGPLMLFVGRLESRKGVEELIRAFIRLKARQPGVRLAVVGDGPLKPRCRELLPRRLTDDVAFLGRLDSADLPAVYAAADLFVAPALGGESFGIVLVEAMAAGTPVVASAIPGYAAVVRDGVDGRLVPPGDVDALATAMEALVTNPRLRRALAAEGRRRAADYDWGEVADRIRNVYASLT